MEDIIEKYLESCDTQCHYCNLSKRNKSFIVMSHKYSDGSYGEICLSERCNSCGKWWTARYNQIGIEGKRSQKIVQY